MLWGPSPCFGAPRHVIVPNFDYCTFSLVVSKPVRSTFVLDFMNLFFSLKAETTA